MGKNARASQDVDCITNGKNARASQDCILWGRMQEHTA